MRMYHDLCACTKTYAHASCPMRMHHALCACTMLYVHTPCSMCMCHTLCAYALLHAWAASSMRMRYTPCAKSHNYVVNNKNVFLFTCDAYFRFFGFVQRPWTAIIFLVLWIIGTSIWFTWKSKCAKSKVSNISNVIRYSWVAWFWKVSICCIRAVPLNDYFFPRFVKKMNFDLIYLKVEIRIIKLV